MKKLLLILGIIFIFAGNLYSASEWDKAEVAGTRSVSDIDYYIVQNNTALDRLLANYNTVVLVYNSASQITASIGEVVCSNSDGSTRKMRQNTSATTVTWAMIDTGAEAASTTYYVYAVADADATTATFMISANSSTPTGATYYKRIGSFYNDSSSNITMGAIYAAAYGTVFANSSGKAPGTFGDWESKSSGTSYLASTDGFCVAYSSTVGGEHHLYGYTDSAATPTTLRCASGGQPFYTSTMQMNLIMPVKKGNYYRVVVDAGLSATVFFIPLGI